DQDPKESMASVRDVIERRVNLFGVSEPNVQIEGDDRLIVELAGIQNIEEAKELIGQTPFLEFRELSDDTASASFIPTGLTGKHLKRSAILFDSTTGQPQVELNLTDEGADLFASITKKNLGKPVAIFLDGQPISIPIVQSEITDGKAVISGQFTPQEAKDLAGRLNAGALPVPISLISQQTVGASLGAESLASSLRAGLYALLAVALFMILFYRLPGVAAVLALVIYTVLVLTIYKLLPVTLTLAGIAGFILSLGIAVDANVLIFARLREELAAGRTLPQAVHEGFHRAWYSIRDSHVTTLLGSAVLYIFTTSIVKGFALTLGIGVLLSLFSSLIVTRAFMNLAIGSWFAKKKWLF
ncbi:MAG: protein translocase subunit SecD, partial [bacterium]|nr:protein translocase subunit SecD [bacterium]